MKIIVISILTLGSLSLVSCKPQEPSVKYMLSDEQLARLMFDVQLSEVVLGEATAGAKDSLSSLFWLRFSEVYKLSKPEIGEEISKLENDLDKMKLIMDRVQEIADSIQ
jgi:hypothetical protein